MTPVSEWGRCRPWIEAALEHVGGTHSIDDIERGIERGQFHFWPGEACAIVTEFNVYPRFKALNFFLVGGNLRELLEMEPQICAWAKQFGCTRVFQIGRAGWSKHLEPLGYKIIRMTASIKEL